MLATLLALPVGAATFITDIVFGLLNRVAPQLNAYFMAMPVKAMAGVALVFVTMEPFVARSKEYIVWSLHAVEHSIELLGGKPLF
jgi:flagellar biosynthetic protein FliR